MYADINRKSIDPREFRISQLLHHQGRVLLPSDLNEHGVIFHYYLRQFIIDFVGERWRPNKDSFGIKIQNDNFTISKGHFYIDGILCANEQECVYTKKCEISKIEVQPYFPTPEGDGSLNLSTAFAVYIECWERHVNSIQKPVIGVVALAGRDTSSRLEIAWQVRIITPQLAEAYVGAVRSALARRSDKKDTEPSNERFGDFSSILFSHKRNADTQKNCKSAQELLNVLDLAEPGLRVWAKKLGSATDPCSISPDDQYRGLENQLYRVEIHDAGVIGHEKDEPTFKWSRENGSVVFRIVAEPLTSVPAGEEEQEQEHTIEVEALGHDRRDGLCVNDWVELLSHEIEFGQRKSPLAKVTKIEPAIGRLTLHTKRAASFTGCTLLRRWDHKDGPIVSTGGIKISEADDDDYEKWISLERGIKIQFQPGGNYRKGDYWLLPARVVSGNVEWPKDNDGIPLIRATDGIKRHRAALSVVFPGDRPNQVSPCGCIAGPICKE